MKQTHRALPVNDHIAEVRAITHEFNRSLHLADQAGLKNKGARLIFDAPVSMAQRRSDNYRARAVSDVLEEMDMPGYKESPTLRADLDLISELSNAGIWGWR
jgi:hypothetical protein